jgi:predicted small secreted protein
MKRILAILPLLSLLALSACTGAHTFGSDLKALEGKPINDAAIMLGGKHTGEYQRGNETVYVWQDHDSESIFGPRITMGHGYGVGSPMNDGSELLMTGLQFNTCVIRAATLDGIIRDITYEGNPGGCESIYGYRKKALGRNAAQ